MGSVGVNQVVLVVGGGLLGKRKKRAEADAYGSTRQRGERGRGGERAERQVPSALFY